MAKRKANEVGNELPVEPRRSSRRKTNTKESLKEEATTASISAVLKTKGSKEKAAKDQLKKGTEANAETSAPKPDLVGYLLLQVQFLFLRSQGVSGPWVGTCSSKALLHRQ